MTDTLILLVAVALCSAAISFTITVTSIFLWFREAVSSVHEKLEELVHCPWCFSHYVTLIILLSSQTPRITIANSGVIIPEFYNFCFTWFVIQCMIGLFHYVLLRAYEPVAKAMLQRKLDKMKNAQTSK